MSTAPKLDRFSAAGEYERHRPKVLGMLERRFPRFDPDERLELYHAVWTTVLEKRRRGQGHEIENLEAYLMGGVDKLAFKRLTRADARRRVSFDPLEGDMADIEDESESPEDRVVLMDEARCAREIVDALDGREREVVKLRFDLGLDPGEVQARLGLGERQYRRLIERASKKMVEHVAALEQGARSRRQLSLLSACLSGIASDRQLAEARELLATDPKARALLRSMRRSAHRVAAALPLPALAASHGDAPGRLAELAAATKQQITELTAGAKHHAVSAYLRASDPTPVAGARPGAVAAAVAGCIAVGGSTYCAVQGVPTPLRTAVGGKPAPKKQVKKETPKPPAPTPAPTPVRSPTATPTPPAPQRQAPAPPPQAPVNPAPAPPPPGSPGGEFSKQSASPTEPAPAPESGPSEFGGP